MISGENLSKTKVTDTVRSLANTIRRTGLAGQWLAGTNNDMSYTHPSTLPVTRPLARCATKDASANWLSGWPAG